MRNSLKSFLMLLGLALGYTGINSVQCMAQLIPVPSKGAYAGAYMEFGETEDDVNEKTIGDFETMTGKKHAIITCSSYWGEESFPSKQLNLIASKGGIPLVFWSPWDKPYDQDKKPGRFSLKDILSGKCDAYIDMWAIQAKDFEKPFFVSLCNEMNGSWFPWSGYYYGKGKKVVGSDGRTTFQGPEMFKKAYRYIIDRVRRQGAKNIVWVFHVNNFSWPEDQWNQIEEYYPGSDYVDWIGMSVYNKQYAKENWVQFHDLFDWPYRQLSLLDANKPIMVTEYGVGEYPKSGNKGKWIAEALEQMSSGKYPRLKAAIFWHEKWQNEDESYSNLRVDSSKGALDAYRSGIAKDFWLGR